jgi:hypothetical protein
VLDSLIACRAPLDGEDCLGFIKQKLSHRVLAGKFSIQSNPAQNRQQIAELGRKKFAEQSNLYRTCPRTSEQIEQ